MGEVSIDRFDSRWGIKLQPNAARAAIGAARVASAARVVDRTDSDREEDKKLLDVCKDFEAVFVSMLMKSMRATVPQSGLVRSDGEGIFREMLDDEYAREVAKSGRLGVADALYRELSQKMAVKRKSDIKTGG